MAEETNNHGNHHKKEGNIHKRGNEENRDQVEKSGENGQKEGEDEGMSEIGSEKEEEARKTRFHSSNETHAEEAEQEKEETQ